MSLRKSPTLTPAFLQANRCNARKSTGPRTGRGKAQSCLNHLKSGMRSRVYLELWHGLLHAPPLSVLPMARALLTPEQARHPLLAELVELFYWAEMGVALDLRWCREWEEARRKGESGAEAGSPATAMGKREYSPGSDNLAGERRKRNFSFDVRSRNVTENTRNNDIWSHNFSDNSTFPRLSGMTKVHLYDPFSSKFTQLRQVKAEVRRLCMRWATHRIEVRTSFGDADSS